MHFGFKDGYPHSPTCPSKLTARIVEPLSAEYPFLHDTMITCWRGQLIMAWYACSQYEMAGKTVIRCRWSEDGVHWSAPETIAERQDGFLCVPVTFQQTDDRLCACIGLMSGPDLLEGLLTFEYDGVAWHEVCQSGDLMIPNSLIKKRGKVLYASGRVPPRKGCLPQIPAVFTAEDCIPPRWSIHLLPGPWAHDAYPLSCPETTLMEVAGGFLAFVRHDGGRAWVYAGSPEGTDWSFVGETDLPIAPVKMCAGTLSTGHAFLLFNEANAQRDRHRLMMAVTSPEKDRFEHLYVLRDGADPSIGPESYWHYPCACEKDGLLYISCTLSDEANTRQAALLTLPVSSLTRHASTPLLSSIHSECS